MGKLRILNIKRLDIFRYLTLGIRISRFAGGFGLVELLVALAIFGIITTFVLLAYGRVSSELRTTSLAYEVALSFREAQSYGVSVRVVEQGAGLLSKEELQSAQSAYGLHFGNGKPNYYTLFVDKWRDDAKPNIALVGQTFRIWRYDGDEEESGCHSSTECVSVFKLGQGNRIEKFCGIVSASGSEECNITELDVSFQRPNPDAIIRTNLSSNDPDRYKAAKIYLKSAQGQLRRTVEVGTTGQIIIK